MFFGQRGISFQILDVLFFDQSNVNKYNFKRNFDAISFRLEADTIIKYKNKKMKFGTNTIGFFPSEADYTRISKRDKMIVVHFKAYNYHSNEIQSFLPGEPQKYITLFNQILDCWQKKDVACKYEASSVLNLIFGELLKDNMSENINETKISSSIKYIEDNCFKKEFSLKETAKLSFISETYFRKLFKEEFGVSPKQYIINKRIKYAASLIIAGYHTLQEIAELCGYNDYKHFSVEFKKLTGVSPGRYTYDYSDVLNELNIESTQE